MRIEKNEKVSFYERFEVYSVRDRRQFPLWFCHYALVELADAGTLWLESDYLLAGTGIVSA